mgnify:CR=1 FL=1
MTQQQTQIRLAQRPDGLPDDSTWTISQGPVPSIEEGQVLVKVLYLSVDPAMRTWLYPGRSYIAPVEVGDVMRAGGVGKVVSSNNPRFAEGDHVVGMMGWQQYMAMDGRGLQKIDPKVAPLSWFLGVLGITGLTAYFGLLDVGEPKEGQTVLVSGAAGAVGSIVGQIAKIKGCRAVGVAGGPVKCQRLTEFFGYDAAIDYKGGDVRTQLKAACPDRVDVYFDNVGGPLLDTVLLRINQRARIVICGAISQYNDMRSMSGPNNYMQLLINRARMEGFVVFDYAQRYGEAIAQMAGWIQGGQLKHREHIVEGIENCPEALRMLFAGANQGKLIVQVG